MQLSERQMAKIEKCLNLSNSANPNEAAAALNAAKSLMRKYGLSDADVDCIGMGETMANSKIPQTLPKYLSAMVSVLASAYQCGVVMDIDREVYIKGKGRNRRVASKSEARAKYIGSRHNAKLAAYSFDVLYRLLMKARKGFIAEANSQLNPGERYSRKTLVEAADSFCYGWVSAALAPFRHERVTEDNQKRIDNWLSRGQGEPTGKAKVKEHSDRFNAVFAEGARQGSQVNVNTPVDGSEQIKLGVM